MKAIIYAIKNVLNNKMYVGSTKSLKKRKYEHFYQLKNGNHHSEHLQKSYSKHGKDKFFFYILEECSVEERLEREIYYINQYNTIDRSFGYNIYEPNENNFKCSESTKQKLSINNPNKVPIDMYKTDGTFIKTYESIAECCKETGFHSSVITEVVNKKNRKSYKSYVFIRKNDLFDYIPSKMNRNMEKYYKQ